ASDPHDPVSAPHVETPPPHFDFAPLLDAQDSLDASAARFEQAYRRWEDRSGATPAGAANRGSSSLASVNETIAHAERALLAADGLKNRPWFKHLLYAPGFYTGYGVKTMPGVRESI